MKTMRFLFVFAGALIAAAVTLGQTNVVGILKIEERTTTDGSTTSPSSGFQYSFEAFIQRTGHNGSESVSSTVPGGSSGSITFGFTVGDGWEYSQSYSGGAAAAKIALDTAFANGDYTVSAATGSVTLTLGSGGADVYPGVPLFTVSNGSFTPFWSAGKLMVDSTQSLTITSSTFTTGFSSGSSMVSVRAEGGTNDINFDANTFGDMTQTSTFVTIPSGNFLVGETYTGGVEFIRWTEVDAGVSISGVTSLAGFSVITEFQIQAIPEPSTYAAIFGALALTGVAIHRRRRLQGS
jgi:hypothetical protein